MSLEELTYPVLQQLESPPTNGHAAASAKRRGPMWPAIEMWTDAAPRRLRNKSAAKTPLKSWGRWLTYLEQRKRPRAIERLIASKTTPLNWGCNPRVRELLTTWSQALRQAERELTQKSLSKKSKPKDDAPPTTSTSTTSIEQLIADWQHAARMADGTTEVLWAVQAVAIARALPELAQLLAAEEWWPLVDELAAVARDAASLNVVEQPLTAQLLGAELPLTLSYQLPELVLCRDLLTPGQQALAAGINELLDGEGVLHQQHWSIQHALAALWTRCRSLQPGLDGKVLNDETLRQYTLAVHELARATRADGGQVLGGMETGVKQVKELRELLAAAWRFVPDLREPKAAAKFQKKLAKTQTATTATATAESTKDAASTPIEEKPRDYAAASVNSEWAQVAIFRRSWKPREPLLACMYAKDRVSLEVSVGGETLVSGTWTSRLQVNGQVLAGHAPWREVCQISDQDVDYLELELQLERGYKIQRQICLGRKERFVYLADSVLGQEPAALGYEQQLPLAQKIVAMQDAEMREVTLAGQLPRARVLPLALPEWRSEKRQGEFEVSENSLTLTTNGQGRHLCAPLWIDLDPKRHAKPLTWRALTIAENRVICSPEIARGWRVQIAERQWIVYRALAGRGNRTILGHNLISEFLLAQFKNGTTTNLVEVE